MVALSHPCSQWSLSHLLVIHPHNLNHHHPQARMKGLDFWVLQFKIIMEACFLVHFDESEVSYQERSYGLVDSGLPSVQYLVYAQNLLYELERVCCAKLNWFYLIVMKF